MSRADEQYAGVAGEADYGEGGDDVDFEADLAAIEAMNAEAEAENDKIQGAVTDAMGTVSEAMADKAAKEQEQKERDARSVFVSNCHWEATGEEVASYFSSCGPVERVTILEDKFGTRKGFCYVEFSSADAVANALILNGTKFRDREIRVTAKRTNVPFHLRSGGASGSRGGRGGADGGSRGFRGRGGSRGGRGAMAAMMGAMPFMNPMAMMGMMGMPPFFMNRGRGRGRGAPRGGGYRGRGGGGAGDS